MEHTQTNANSHDSEHHGHHGNNHDHTHNETTSGTHTAKALAHAGALEAYLVPLFAQVPHLPEGGKKVITDIIPWVSLIFGALGIIALFTTSAVGLLLSPLIMLGGGFKSIMIFLIAILGLVSSVFTFISFNPLRDMSKKGWNYAFYALIISTVSTVLGLFFTMYSGGVGSLLGVIVGAYLLFEIREKYH